ncbi:hypothetical protein V6N13_035963 [Hibiscus sabdariffa]|uniref:Uncharacterized protein n=1 Tax=Hibiscus sabdariffa TaxID=183260 RepID=A0ABR1ZKC3_9ROSI
MNSDQQHLSRKNIYVISDQQRLPSYPMRLTRLFDFGREILSTWDDLENLTQLAWQGLATYGMIIPVVYSM